MRKSPLAVITELPAARKLYFILVLAFLLSGIFLMTASTANALESLRAGMKGPDFSLRDLNGQTTEFNGIKGKKLTVLLFWSTWSAYSGKALKQMERLYEKYRRKGLSVLAIDVDAQEITGKTISQIKSEISRLKLDLPVSIDYGLVAFHDYGVIAVPSTVILDNNRVIKYELAGFPLVGSADMADYIRSRFKSSKTAHVAEAVGDLPVPFDPEP